MPFVVGVAGQARSGKDSAANYLSLLLGGKFKRVSLAHKVKEIFAENFGVSLEFTEHWKTKKEIPPGFDMSVRDCLIHIGDGWRKIRSNIWIEKMFDSHQSKNADKTPANLIVSDVRYINESNVFRGVDKIKQSEGYRGITVLCWRPGYENDIISNSEQELMPFVKHLAQESSEIINHSKYPNVPFDVWLVNDGTESQWHRKVKEIVLPLIIEKT